MLLWPRQVLARAPDEKPRVVPTFGPDDTDSAIRSSVVAFAQGMRTAGWTAGANVGLDYRLAAQILNARPRLPAEAADLKPTV